MACFTACGIRGRAHAPNLIVLGVDGMDPGFVERHWQDLPNLSRLRAEGTFQKLGTTIPPQSPVAWSTFITGLDPAGHGLFDFVHRDPRSMEPFSSMSSNEPPRFSLTLGSYVLPLSPSHVVSLRHGVPFWKLISDRGIPVSVIRMPTNYPPVQAGHAISGMGTPDLRGTLGTFTFYTDDPEELSRDVSGGRIVKVDLQHGHAVLRLEGPPNALRKDHAYAVTNLIVDVDRDHPVMRLQCGDRVQVLNEGEWSGWLRADFPLISPVSSVGGEFRVYVKQLHPVFELYVSPVNIDPAAPALPVSAPANWSRKIAKEDGRFFTLGIPEDTSALRQGVFTLPEFLRQTHLVFEDEQRLLRRSLRDYKGGLLFFYFSSVDQNSHILWNRYDAELLKVYREIDECAGEVRKAFPSAKLLILSDHGFTTFGRAVNLNTWLNHRGFLSLKSAPGEDTSLHSIDWPQTEAYAIGLNGLYLNLKGREREGILASSERLRATAATLKEQLLAWRDPANGRQVIEAVYPVNAAKDHVKVAPDFIVGYAAGYRASWETGLGATPADELTDNDDAWIADHCVNPADVPGVLFTSWRIRPAHARLQDITVSILKMFGISPPPDTTGEDRF
ncbi:MAG TPA: alkaline phosphatase family protein [Bryobacteraceae bacterium]|jgi:predicted AlkP superfamily phosphohydrolase/phosphomutase